VLACVFQLMNFDIELFTNDESQPQQRQQQQKLLLGLRAKALNSFRRDCISRLQAYPTTIEEDELFLMEKGEIPTNVRNGVLLRLGEKKLFSHFLEEIASISQSQALSLDQV